MASTSFRPLTRIHLLLTDFLLKGGKKWLRFPTSDEDSSTPDEAAKNAPGIQMEFPTSDEDSSTPDQCSEPTCKR